MVEKHECYLCALPPLPAHLTGSEIRRLDFSNQIWLQQQLLRQIKEPFMQPLPNEPVKRVSFDQLFSKKKKNGRWRKKVQISFSGTFSNLLMKLALQVFPSKV